MLPIINLLTNLNLGGKNLQETSVSFDFITLEVVTIMAQSQTKNYQFLTRYASWLC